MILRASYYVMFFLLFSALARAQGTSPSDSVQNEKALTRKYASLFGPAWSKMFVEKWNVDKDTAKVLGGLSKVYFISVDKETTAALMEFDSLGLVSYRSSKLPDPKDSLPRFTAKLIRWAEFMEGKFRAVAGVLTRKIEYHGPMTVAFKYGFYFDKVAPVGRHIVELLNVKKAGSAKKTK